MLPSQDDALLLNPKQLAKLLNVSTETLELWRSTGKGPVFLQMSSRVRYLRSDVDTWIEELRTQPRVRSAKRVNEISNANSLPATESLPA